MSVADRSAVKRMLHRLRARHPAVDVRERSARPEEPPPNRWRGTVASRLAVAGCCFALWGVAIEARLVYLQVIAHDDLVARAERQQRDTITAAPKRGDILDRRGRVLAYSVDADTIYAVPREIDDPAHVSDLLCGALAGCDDIERKQLLDRLSRRKRQFAYVRRRVSPDDARSVAALDLPGVGFLKESRRYYPKRELAAHVVGYAVEQGLAGIEAAYDRLIGGRAGTLLIHTDAKRRAFSRLERPPVPGSTLELTIDEYLQHVAERELRIAVHEHRAAGGTIVIMEPHTGELLAVANEPSFNPNMFGKTPAIAQRNRAVQDLYEPGSTFKVVTASAALEENIARTTDKIDVSAGMIRFGSRQIEDVHRYGVLSFTDVIVKSSNVGAIKVGLRLGRERLGRYVRRFGFGQTLSPDFPGESAGIVWDPARLDGSALASVSMGYQVGVTPLQMVTAVSSVANGGNLMEPRVVKAIIADGKRTEIKPRVLRRTIGPATATTLTEIMEAVVERGTAQSARIDGYTIAGKTGTAAKLVNGRYSNSEYNASFVGFLPSRNPALAIIVMIDSPHGKGYYGGAVAAPVFKRVGEEALRHLGIGPNLDPPSPVLVARHPGARAAETPLPVSAGATSELPLSDDPTVMPNLQGLSAREALRRLARRGMVARLSGDGFVIDQEPAAGVPVEQSTSCILRLSRVVPAPLAPTDQPAAGGTNP